MLTKNTLAFIHRTYNSVAEDSQSIDLIDILQEIHTRLLEYDVPQEDAREFDTFLRNIERSIHIRKTTFDITSFMCNITLTLLYIAVWANECKNLGIDINYKLRRKSLESELTKALRKSSIRDMFGIRGILLNKNSKDDSVETKKLLALSELVEDIFTQSRLNTKNTYYEFYEWVQKNSEFNYNAINMILQTPFKLETTKDYITNPKPNNYMSLHLILAVEVFSDFYPGFEFELQFRTHKMHQEAENGKANHDTYKEDSIDDEIKKVFTIDDISKANIVGLSSYKSPEDDIDGLHYAKTIYNRRVKGSLIIF